MEPFKPPPEWNEALRSLSVITREAAERLQRSFAAVTASSALEQMSRQLPRFEDWFATYRSQLASVLAGWRQLWEDSLPANWEGFADAEEVTSVIERVEETGFCLVWLPRVEIVREIMAADKTACGNILLSHLDEVLADAEAVLSDVVEPDLRLEREAALEAIRTLRDGHNKAAQALAASVFTSTVHFLFETSKTRKIRKQMAETHPEDAGMQELRLRTIYVAGARALDDFYPAKARPVRREFNRHNTAHRLTVEQWTERNALSAVMLATALLREVDFWIARERSDQVNGSGR